MRGFLPMKEFTTYPKKKKSEVADNSMDSIPTKKQQTEIFIKLKDDHTFAQCTSLQFSDGEDESQSLEEQLESELSKREKESFLWTGTWDFVNSKLILAADRPDPSKKAFSMYDEDSSADGNIDMDTILIGKVAVTEDKSLTDNPALEQHQSTDTDTEGSSSSQSKSTIDVHLSVPKGKIQTGKYMYPQNHPSFFEQPIYNPDINGRFELRQILGEYNAKLEDEKDKLIELYRKKDLVGKRFYLSTFPLKKRRKKFEFWDKQTQSYKEGEYEPSEQEKKEDELTPGKNMQVMAVELFANNTFSTVSGLGTSTVLRGKWSIIGEKRDHLWMMVYRFGFGRSISGNTFSEGMSLTQDDEKAYWGLITQEPDGSEDSIEADPSQWGNKKVQIEGAVMIGWGLEPTSTGRFKMIEIEDDLEEEEEEEEDDEEEEVEYEEMSVEDVSKTASSFDSMLETDDDSDDLESDLDIGAFE